LLLLLLFLIEKKVILTVFASCWKKLVFVLKNYIFARTAFQWKEPFFLSSGKNMPTLF